MICHSNEAQQAAVNPAHNSSMVKEGSGAGAPPALTYDQKAEMRIKAFESMKEILDMNPTDCKKKILSRICDNIWAGKIPHVRFCYENN